MKKIGLIISIILVFPYLICAQELSPARAKEVNKAVDKFESAVASQGKNGIMDAEKEVLKIGKDAVPGLKKVFTNKSKDNVVRHKAMELSAKLKDEAVADPLVSVVKDKSEEWYHRTASLQYLGLLVQELKKENRNVDKKYMKDLEETFDDESNNIKIREGALGVYGQIGQNDALPKLVEKLNDSNKNIVTNAVYGIGAVQTTEGEQALLDGYLKQKGTFVEGTYVWLFARRKIKTAAPYIVQALKELKGKSMPITAERGNYIDTLGDLGDQSVIPILQEIANNPDVTYSSLSAAKHAAKALVKLGDYETMKKVIKKVEIDGRGDASDLKKIYKSVTGNDFSY